MARPREYNEIQVVQKAMNVFWEKGYAATSVQDLVDATGLQRGSLYGAFGDKQGLYVAALNAYIAAGLQHFLQGFDTADDPVEAVRIFVRKVGSRCVGDTASLGCMVGNACGELAAHDEITRDRVLVFLSAMKDEIAKSLRRGQSQGTFGADRDPEAVATFIQCGLQGLTLLGKSNPAPGFLSGVVNEILRVLD